MKKNTLFSLLLAMMTVAFTAANAAPVVMLEEAIESESLQIKITKDLSGVVRGKICDRCETIVVNITPETKLYIKGKQVDLSKASSRSGKPGTVVFNIKTQKVTKIYSD